MYPSWEELEDELNPAKRALISFLDRNIPENWKIFVEPCLNGSYPDLILLNPDKGFMIYKVMESLSESVSPEMDKKQLDYYRNKIIQELVPDMAEKMDVNPKIFVVTQIGVYIHDLGGEEVRERYADYPYLAAGGYDDLDEVGLGEILPGVEYTTSKFMESEWTDELESWLKPPYHREKRTDLELTDEQKKRSKPQPGHKRLRGSAGSGKTLVVAYRAAQLAAEGHKVLVITYNRTLWYYIRSIVDKTPYNFEWSNVTFRHFHGFCRDILNELMVPMDDINDAPFIVEYSIKDRDIEKFKFDSILIDEGQDYEWDWYHLLSQFLNGRDELFFVCDKKQNVYDRELNWIDNMGDFKGKVKFRGKWPELNTVYRLPKEIAQVSNRFSEEYGLDQSVHMDFSQATLLKDSKLFQWKNIQVGNWLSDVREAYNTIRKLGVKDNSEIVILVPKNSTGIELVEFFKGMGVEVDHVFVEGKKWRNKKTFVSGNGRLRISTIHKFKGWEAKNVIMLVPTDWAGDENLDSIVYTAMTRTLENLIVLNANERYWDFGREFEEDEILEEVEEDLDGYELEAWMETLPYPLASILWAGVSSFNYEHKVKYLLNFFEALSEFNFNLILSGFATDRIFFEREVSAYLKKENEYRDDWFEKPSFGIWNNLYYNMASILRNQLINSYKRDNCLKFFGNPKIEFLESLSNFELVMLLKEVSKHRNIWEGHGPRVSEDEYHKRYNILLNDLFKVRDILQDVYRYSFLVIPVQGTMENGEYHYTVKRYMTTRSPFRPMNLDSNAPLDNSKLYLATSSKKDHLELLPLFINVDDVCYFYNGKNEETGLARYNSYHYDREPEILVPFDRLEWVLRLVG